MAWKKRVTMWVVFVVAAILLSWDLYVWLTPPDEDTISEVIARWSEEWTVIPFTFGVLMGHFFWPVKRAWKEACPKCGTKLTEQTASSKGDNSED